ncbi:hypothetical protein C8F04DRAFT_1200853 [Mycena alexandri]|uniref:Uncharacterized protein n=1 Tax=Mycena alexandri TaxID=1745969 RepID=A0AAD6RXR8_9AGAR|nr:hypothetical protein C8F04DRAFT_1200853 [Mycena alexandri]
MDPTCCYSFLAGLPARADISTSESLYSRGLTYEGTQLLFHAFLRAYLRGRAYQHKVEIVALLRDYLRGLEGLHFLVVFRGMGSAAEVEDEDEREMLLKDWKFTVEDVAEVLERAVSSTAFAEKKATQPRADNSDNPKTAANKPSRGKCKSNMKPAEKPTGGKRNSERKQADAPEDKENEPLSLHYVHGWNGKMLAKVCSGVEAKYEAYIDQVVQIVQDCASCLDYSTSSSKEFDGLVGYWFVHF